MTDIFRFLLDKTDDSRGGQILRGRGYAGEELTDVYRVLPWGFTSHAPEGSTGIGVALGGHRDKIAALGVEADRPGPARNLPAGAAALYDASGCLISLIERNVRLVAAEKITLKAAEIIIDGVLRAGGEDAAQPAAMLGSVDSAGHPITGATATKVFVK